MDNEANDEANRLIEQVALRSRLPELAMRLLEEARSMKPSPPAALISAALMSALIMAAKEHFTNRNQLAYWLRGIADQVDSGAFDKYSAWAK